jgi:hypothetical protein
MAGRRSGNGAAARSPERSTAGSLRTMVSDADAGREPPLEDRLRHAVGYRVDAPEGYLGRVQSVPHAGRPARPLVLVVSDGETVRFVTLRRVAAVLPHERRIVLGPRPIAAASRERVAPLLQAA